MRVRRTKSLTRKKKVMTRKRKTRKRRCPQRVLARPRLRRPLRPAPGPSPLAVMRRTDRCRPQSLLSTSLPLPTHRPLHQQVEPSFLCCPPGPLSPSTSKWLSPRQGASNMHRGSFVCELSLRIIRVSNKETWFEIFEGFSARQLTASLFVESCLGLLDLAYFFFSCPQPSRPATCIAGSGVPIAREPVASADIQHRKVNWLLSTRKDELLPSGKRGPKQTREDGTCCPAHTAAHHPLKVLILRNWQRGTRAQGLSTPTLSMFPLSNLTDPNTILWCPTRPRRQSPSKRYHPSRLGYIHPSSIQATAEGLTPRSTLLFWFHAFLYFS